MENRRRILVQQSDTLLSILFIGIGTASTGFLAALLSLNFYANVIIHRNNAFMPSNIGLLYIAASLASLMVGSSMWWYFITKSDSVTLKRGIIVGVMASAITHPVTWIFAELITYISSSPILTGFTLENPFDAVFTAFFISMFSLLFVGWLTALIGGIAGALFITMQRADEQV
jgi:hypothetical protein